MLRSVEISNINESKILQFDNDDAIVNKNVTIYETDIKLGIWLNDGSVNGWLGSIDTIMDRFEIGLTNLWLNKAQIYNITLLYAVEYDDAITSDTETDVDNDSGGNSNDNNNNSLKQFNIYANYVIWIVFGFIVLLNIIGYIDSKFLSMNEKFKFMSFILASLHFTDFVTDILFSNSITNGHTTMDS